MLMNVNLPASSVSPSQLESWVRAASDYRRSNARFKRVLLECVQASGIEPGVDGGACSDPKGLEKLRRRLFVHWVNNDQVAKSEVKAQLVRMGVTPPTGEIPEHLVYSVRGKLAADGKQLSAGKFDTNLNAINEGMNRYLLASGFRVRASNKVEKNPKDGGVDVDTTTPREEGKEADAGDMLANCIATMRLQGHDDISILQTAIQKGGIKPESIVMLGCELADLGVQPELATA